MGRVRDVACVVVWRRGAWTMKAPDTDVWSWRISGGMVVVLAGCRSPVEVAYAPAPRPVDTASLVAQVRASAVADDALLVEPLRDAQTEDLYQAVLRLEQQGEDRKSTRLNSSH